ncbi:MAG: tRNA (adenosine(37)-N6)-dimethylallyltransferase MiaA [Clostridia bacterium]|nr:tRNA (adenosine(37)-N6)-dimethylallyltransferase MiaA [Clostridia bacterium]
MTDLIVICGPTGSGKTDLAIDLAIKLNTEIISADSMNIYKGFDIGTAKPSLEELSKVKHHLIDVCDGNDTFSVSDYEKQALPIINDLISKGKIPIIVGGTGFYINSLLYGLSYGNSAKNEEIREKYNQMANEFGVEKVFERLKEIDPDTAEKLHPNDLKRVIRAIEIFETAGQKKSEIVDDLTPRFNYKAYMIDFDRKVLYDRINKRVDIMFEKGLVDEVKNLLSSGVKKDAQSMQGIGYKEVVEFLENAITFDELTEKIKQNTRRYAKRQITFFKRLDGLNYLKPTKMLSKEIIENL